jgi:pyruvate formate lyase activating enzyme
MDQEQKQKVQLDERPHPNPLPKGEGTSFSRRDALKYGAAGLACLACGGSAVFYLARRCKADATNTVFKGDAPSGELWDLWKKRGWAQEARHYLKPGENILCKLCPNECALEPEDRGHCRNRVHKDGKLYTLAYANPCTFHLDPIEKKPLLHFLPGSSVFSLATAGCGFRCLNCQNWEISQRKPEETKDPRGEPLVPGPHRLDSLTSEDLNRMSMFPDDVVAIAEYFSCPSIAYTYSEPIAWFEYMIDIAKAARAKNIKNCWITCGYIQDEPLKELCKYIDAANVNLKSFDEEIYRDLNSGKLQPVLDTLKTLKREGVWFEVTNLVVPTYTDKPDMIRRMCDWLLANIGPDYPLHFSRFQPLHKLTHLHQTPKDILLEAQSIARQAGLNHVYIGNCYEVSDAETTYCPKCKKAVIQRDVFSVLANHVIGGKCEFCSTAIAGVWKA